MNYKKGFLFSTKWIAYTALLTAFVVVMGYVPGLPMIPAGKVYWCDFAIFMAAYLLDPVAALIVGGVGTSFFDLFGINGTAYNALPSLIIHGLQGFVAAGGLMLLKKFFNKDGDKKREMILAIAASILPALIVIFGYFIKRTFLEAGGTPAYALSKMPANIVQEIVGVAVAVVICYLLRLKEQLIKNRLLPQWRENNEG